MAKLEPQAADADDAPGASVAASPRPMSAERRVRPRSRWDTIARWILTVTVAIIPLTFLPWLRGLLPITQQSLALIGVVCAVIAWIAGALSTGTFALPRLPAALLGIGAAAIVAVTVSALATGNAKLAFWGSDAADVDSGLLAILGVLIVCGTAAMLQSARDVRRLVGALQLGILCSLIPVVANHAALLVLRHPIFGITTIAYTPAGSVSAYAVMLGIAVLLGFRTLGEPGGVVRRILRALSIVIPLIAMAIMSPKVVLLALAGGIAVLLMCWFGAHGREVQQRILELNSMLAVLFVAVLLAFSGIRLGALGYPAEVSPAHGASARIAASALRSGPRAFLIGRGPDTYAASYNAYRVPEVRRTAFRNVEFRQAVSYWWTILASFGVIPTALLLAFVLGVLGIGVRAAFRAEAAEGTPLLHALIAAGAYAMIALLAYPTRTTAFLCTFAVFGALVVRRRRAATVAIFATPQRAFFGSLALTGVLVGGLFTFIVTGRRYAAAAYLERGVRSATAAAPGSSQRDVATRDALRAHALFPTDVSASILAQLAFDALARELSQVTKANAEERQPQVQSALSAAIQFARAAAELRPDVHGHWALLGRVYQSAIGIADGADQSALDAFARARQAYPTSPAYLLASAGVRLAQVDRRIVAAETALPRALADLESALALEPDHADALLLLAQVYERQGKIDTAIARARSALAAQPNHIGILFTIGALEYRQGRRGAAQAMFERALRVNPNYANARYFLGLIAEEEGRRDEALQHFEAVFELNPDNAEVRKKVDALRAAPTTPSAPEP